MSGHDERLLSEAADWLVRVENEPHCQAGFDTWRHADPRHDAAARSLEQVLMRFEALSAAPAHAALNAASHLQTRRRSRRTVGLAVLLTLLLPLGLFLHSNPPALLLADLRTGTGQWHEAQLDDGSRMILDSRSAADLHFDVRQRRVDLLQGDILVDVAKDAARPFIVETAHGNIRALGTRFIVEQRADATWLTMLESAVEVRSRATGASLKVSAGQRLRLDDQGLGSVQALDSVTVEQAWRNHQWVVWDRPLPEVLDGLSRFYNGYLSYDAQTLADLRVSAVLPMDDPQRALRLLQQSFAVQVQHYGPWLVRVSRDQPREK